MGRLCERSGLRKRRHMRFVARLAGCPAAGKHSVRLGEKRGELPFVAAWTVRNLCFAALAKAKAKGQDASPIACRSHRGCLITFPPHFSRVLLKVGAGHGKLAIAKLGTRDVLGRDGFRLTSAAFDDGEELDPSFTAEEEDSVAPPLEWTQPPAGTQELVLIVEDPDAPAPEPFCHWLVWGLPGQRGKLLEGETPPRVGKNAFGNSEWLLPDPPTGQDQHDYVFQLFALDEPLALLPGATRAEIVAAMQGHVIGAAVLTGTYARSAEADEVDWDGEGE